MEELSYLFITYDMRTGVTPTGIQRGDLVCDLSPEKTEPRVAASEFTRAYTRS